MKKLTNLVFLLLINGYSFGQLNTVPIGSAGNLYTIIVEQSNMVAADQNLNSVIFIHRNNDAIFGGTTSEYRYDISIDGGANWTNDIGSLNPSANQTDKRGRYPQAIIYNPLFNSVLDSAYLIYLGASHNAGDWNATFSGVARLDSDVSTWTETHTVQNGGNSLIPSGLCEGQNGVFWAVDWAYDGTNLNNIIVYRGTFDNTLKDVIWVIDTLLDPDFDLSFDGTEHGTALNMAFDRSGQYGWISYLADVYADSVVAYVYSPVFFKTVDGGNTWQGPIGLNLKGFQNALARYDTSTGNSPGTTFEGEIVVDKNGDPHLCVGVSVGTDYSVSTGNYVLQIHDFTYSSATDEWKSILLDSLLSFRGDVTAGASPLDQDNRPQVSVSPAGDKIFFFWVDSDTAKATVDVNGNYENDAPDLIGRGLDINTQMLTPRVNYTINDLTWSGLALFPSVAPTSLSNGSDYSIPTVLTQLGVNDLALEPVFFHYVTNIGYNDSDFTEQANISIYFNNNPPVANFYTDDTLTCVGNTVSLSNLSTGGISYDWSFPGGNPSSSTFLSPQVSYDSTDTYDVQLIVTNSNGTDTLEFLNYITVVDAQTTSILKNNISCSGGSDGSANLSVIGGTTPYAYNWSNGATTEDLSTINAGTYVVTVIDAIGCVVLDTANVSEPSALSLFTSSTPASQGSSDGTATVSVTGGTAPYNYSWNNGQTTSTAINLASGNYTVIVTDDNDCQDTAVVQVSEGIGFSNPDILGAFEIYPNPSSGKITIEIPKQASVDAEIVIYNILGEVMLRKKIPSHQHKLDLSNYSRGIYFISITFSDVSVTRKLIVKNTN
ncbi:T9SS type A sorting domain-containing protein [Candidatus Amoebophilus asiaticus]|nr:T9SS type A sorting domain-containing protein [Candidatus Amoebophilus asiaticus]